MSDKEQETSSDQTPQSPTGTPQPATTVILPPGAPGDLLPIVPAPPLVSAELLLAGLHQLKERIPDYTHLTPREARGMGRAANLDPEFVNAGVHTVSSWPDAKEMVGWSGEELRQLVDETRRWDDVERELRIVLKGISDANVKRKNELGSAILLIYAILPRLMKRAGTQWLRPYYEEMHAAWKRSRERTRRKKEERAEGDESKKE
jgi:hypothetical protein